MSDKFFQTKAFLSYWLDAVDEHSLHSPFFYDLYTRLYAPKITDTGNAQFENLRKKLTGDQRPLKTVDFGSGTSSKEKTIGAIATTSLSSVKMSSFYARMIDHFKCRQIVELGTSFGVNTLYLASKKENAVTTFEGSPEVADIAKLTFQFSASTNVKLVEGNIDTTLPSFINSVRKVDFIFMDANHRYEPTIRYFNHFMPKLSETSVVVVDDIHYSAEMNKAWNDLKNHKLVYGSADFFRCGILFFDPSLNKQHVILQV